MTDKLREAAKQALEALDWFVSSEMTVGQRYTDEGQAALDAITALRAALAEQAAEQAVIPPAFAHAARQQMAVTSEWCRGWDACRAHILSAAPAAEQAGAIPAGWVPLRMEWEPGYPEDVAFGPPRMMERLKKWLDKHFAARVAETNAAPAEPVRRYTVERHGSGWAIYAGRDQWHHGANLGHLTECDDALPRLLERALNAAPAEPVAFDSENPRCTDGGEACTNCLCLGKCLRAAQAAPAEPVGFMNAGHLYELQRGRLPYAYLYPRECIGAHVAVYATPPVAKEQSKPLTDDEAWAMCDLWPGQTDAAKKAWLRGFRAGERAHGSAQAEGGAE